MKNRISREAIKLDLNYFFRDFHSLYDKNTCLRPCLIYVCRRKGYTLKEIGSLVGSVASTIHKELLKVENVLDSGKESELRTCLVMCKIRFSC